MSKTGYVVSGVCTGASGAIKPYQDDGNHNWFVVDGHAVDDGELYVGA